MRHGGGYLTSLRVIWERWQWHDVVKTFRSLRSWCRGARRSSAGPWAAREAAAAGTRPGRARGARGALGALRRAGPKHHKKIKKRPGGPVVTWLAHTRNDRYKDFLTAHSTCAALCSTATAIFRSEASQSWPQSGYVHLPIACWSASARYRLR